MVGRRSVLGNKIPNLVYVSPRVADLYWGLAIVEFKRRFKLGKNDHVSNSVDKSPFPTNLDGGESLTEHPYESNCGSMRMVP